MGASVSRKGDELSTGHLCDTSTTLDAPTQSSVFVNNILASILGTKTITHNVKVGNSCVPHTHQTTSASSKVFINNIGINRVGDDVDSGNMVQGSSDVFAG